LHQVGDLFELNVKLWCQKVKQFSYIPTEVALINKLLIFISFVMSLIFAKLSTSTVSQPQLCSWCLDCRRGQSLVVWAISEGRQVAREVDAFLMGSSALPGPGGVITVATSSQKG
jgi:hypothetical protein